MPERNLIRLERISKALLIGSLMAGAVLGILFITMVAMTI